MATVAFEFSFFAYCDVIQSRITITCCQNHPHARSFRNRVESVLRAERYVDGTVAISKMLESALLRLHELEAVCITFGSQLLGGLMYSKACELECSDSLDHASCHWSRLIRDSDQRIKDMIFMTLSTETCQQTLASKDFTSSSRKSRQRSKAVRQRSYPRMDRMAQSTRNSSIS